MKEQQSPCGGPLSTVVRDVTKDFADLMRDFGLCFVHTGSLYVVLIFIGLSSGAAVIVAATVGTQRVFSTETHTNYLHRTARRCKCGVKKVIHR